MGTNYIEELYKTSLHVEMEREFEKQCCLSKATFIILPGHKQMKIVICDRKFKFVKAYVATEFDCIPEDQNMMDFDFKEYPKSGAACDDQYVRRFYLKFMKNHFETYYEDYKAYQLELVEKVFKDETTV